MLYRVYYAAFVKDSSATGAPPTPYKIMDVKSEPVPAITTTEAPAQQQAMSLVTQPHIPYQVHSRTPFPVSQIHIQFPVFSLDCLIASHLLRNSIHHQFLKPHNYHSQGVMLLLHQLYLHINLQPHLLGEVIGMIHQL